jgi:hypothetical protein
VHRNLPHVIPAKAGIQLLLVKLGPGLRRDDEVVRAGFPSRPEPLVFHNRQKAAEPPSAIA